MNGFIGRMLAAACLAAGLAAVGCCGYSDMVDPCYPQRYNFAARTEVCAALTPQVKNGHVLDQTIWNWMFDQDPNTGQQVLNAAGRDKLLQLIRRRPVPDPIIFLATAQDIKYDPATPNAFAEERHKVDDARQAAVQKYVYAQTADRGIAFQVCIHDPAEPDLPAQGLVGSIRGYYAGWGAGGGAAPAAAPGR